MTAYVTLRQSLELCLLKPYDWDAIHGLLAQLEKDYPLRVRLDYIDLFTKAGSVKACRIQFFQTLNELRTAYGTRLPHLEGQYHQDMGEYLRYRNHYHKAKAVFFNDLDKRERVA